ncbi:MAG: type II toxin-antitoxin system RelE/ParE family toxin [Candidatus Aquirickettsiella gammari]
MARIIYSQQALNDLERLVDFLFDYDPNIALTTLDLIQEAILLLEHHPLIGRPIKENLRELVISRCNTGYIGLYSFEEFEDVILVLGIRHQREAGYEN